MVEPLKTDANCYVLPRNIPLSTVQLRKVLLPMALPRIARFGLGVSLLSGIVACAPPLQTLNPVTLQPDARRTAGSDGLTEALPIAESTKPNLAVDSVATDLADPSEPATAEQPAVSDTSIEVVPPKTQVISGESDQERPSLVEVARQEQLRRDTSPSSRLRIDDKNLKRHATANMTSAFPDSKVGTESGAQAAAEISESDDSAQQEAAVESERYWRALVRELRYDWQDLVFEEENLEQEVERLRKEYYQEDDPYYRDGEIKPEWDASWQSLQATTLAIQEAINKLDRAIEEGRRAGALPGWLREGVELEPIDSSTESRNYDTGNQFGAADAVEPNEASEAVEIEP